VRDRWRACRYCSAVQHFAPAGLLQAVTTPNTWRSRQRPARRCRCRLGVGGHADRHHPQSPDRAAA
jgi:hypothetical protein